MSLPDSLAGAGILSLLDFALSFVFIAAIGVVLSSLACLNKLGNLPTGKGRRS